MAEIRRHEKKMYKKEEEFNQTKLKNAGNSRFVE